MLCKIWIPLSVLLLLFSLTVVETPVSTGVDPIHSLQWPRVHYGPAESFHHFLVDTCFVSFFP